MSQPARSITTHAEATYVLWALVAIYAVARVLQPFAGRVPMLGIVALHVFPPAVFALIHGGRFYGSRGIVTFVAICLVVGNCFENLGVLTGVPFGRYYFTDVMGPKLLHVPILLGLAYVGMGYLSWTLGRLILGSMRRPLTGSRVVTLPLVAAWIMVSWDLSMDPIWSTVEHAWIWLEGGTYFGVPVTNFLEAGISLSMSSTSGSRSICETARPCPTRPPSIGAWPWCSTEFPQQGTSSSSSRWVGLRW